MAKNEKIAYVIEIITEGANKSLDYVAKQAEKTKDRFDDMNESVKKTGQALKDFDVKGVIKGLGGMTKAALAFIATPLGAAIAAISAAIAAMTSYLKGSEEGQNRLNRIMTIGSAIMGKFSDAVQAVGKFIFEGLIKGLEASAKLLSKVIPGFDNLTKSVEKFLNLDVATHASNLKELEIRLNRQLILEREILKSEIEAAKLRSETTKDIKEKNKALDEAEEKINKLYRLEHQLEVVRLRILEGEGKLSNNQREANDKIQEQKAKLYALDGQRIAQLKEIETKQFALNEQEIAAKQKSLELTKEQIELNKYLSDKENQDISDKIQYYQESLEQFAQIEEEKRNKRIEGLEIEKDEEENIEAVSFGEKTKWEQKAFDLKMKYLKMGMSEEAASAMVHKELEAQKLAATQNALSTGMGLFKENTIAYKALATAQATIDTYQNAVKAYQAGLDVGGPWGVALGAIFAALAVAQGLQNVSKISGVAAAGGADFVTKGPTMLIVGDNPGGREHVKVTPMSGRGTTRTFGGGIAMAGGGTLIAGGSAIANTRTAEMDAQFMMMDSLKSLPAPVLNYTEYTEFQNKINFKESLTSQ